MSCPRFSLMADCTLDWAKNIVQDLEEWSTTSVGQFTIDVLEIAIIHFIITYLFFEVLSTVK